MRRMGSTKARISEILGNKSCLIVLDDVWEVAHAESFKNALGPRCRLLVTTRDGGLATSLGAEQHRLDVLGNQAALQLLSDWAGMEGKPLPVEGQKVADECGNLPFALALCGAMVRDGILWDDLLDALHEVDLGFIEKQFPNYPYPNVLRALQVSIDALSEHKRRRYQELAVFPEDIALPEETIVMLWLYTGRLNERNARKLVTELHNNSLLVAEGRSPNRRVRLHDLNHDYLQAVTEEISILHEKLLAAYATKCPDGWPTGPNDGYFFEHLAYHLNEAGRNNELSILLTNSPQWMERKSKLSTRSIR